MRSLPATKLYLELIFSAAIVLLCPTSFAQCEDPLNETWFTGETRKELATLNFDQGAGIAQLSSKPLFTKEEHQNILNLLKNSTQSSHPSIMVNEMQMQFDRPLTTSADSLKKVFGDPIAGKLLSYLKELEDHLNQSQLFNKAEGKLVIHSVVIRGMDQHSGFKIDDPMGHVHGPSSYIDAIKAELGDGLVTFQNGNQVQHPTAVTTLFTDGGRVAHLKKHYGTDYFAEQTRHKSPDIQSDRLIILLVIHSEDWQKWTRARAFD